jgi:hypothetical protein
MKKFLHITITWDITSADNKVNEFQKGTNGDSFFEPRPLSSAICYFNRSKTIQCTASYRPDLQCVDTVRVLVQLSVKLRCVYCLVPTDDVSVTTGTIKPIMLQLVYNARVLYMSLETVGASLRLLTSVSRIRFTSSLREVLVDKERIPQRIFYFGNTVWRCWGPFIDLCKGENQLNT